MRALRLQAGLTLAAACVALAWPGAAARAYPFPFEVQPPTGGPLGFSIEAAPAPEGAEIGLRVEVVNNGPAPLDAGWVIRHVAPSGDKVIEGWLHDPLTPDTWRWVGDGDGGPVTVVGHPQRLPVRVMVGLIMGMGQPGAAGSLSDEATLPFWSFGQLAPGESAAIIVGANSTEPIGSYALIGELLFRDPPPEEAECVVPCPRLHARSVHCNQRNHCEYQWLHPDETWRVDDGWIYAPPGAFTMGREEGGPDVSRPIREVIFDDGFFFALDEVTVRVHEACEAAGACGTPSVASGNPVNWGLNRSANGRAGHPQNGVSASGAEAVCTYRGGRLPSEAEWEYVAKGAEDARRNPWGDEEPICGALANVDPGFQGCGRGGTHPTGPDERPQGLSMRGLVDQGGNLGTWTADCWHDNYTGAPTDGSAWTTGCLWGFPVRGGGAAFGAESVRSAARLRSSAWRSFAIGARCAHQLRIEPDAWMETGISCAGTPCPVLDAPDALGAPAEGYEVSCNEADACEYRRVIVEEPWQADDIWVYVPPGSFEMGSPAGEPASVATERRADGTNHTVTFEDGYFIAKLPVTVRLYEACEAAGACTAPSVADSGPGPAGLNRSNPDPALDRSTHPQNGILPVQSHAVCGFIGGRTPSEAEWEFAAKGPDVHRVYPWGDEPAPVCRVHAIFNNSAPGCGTGGTAEVGAGYREEGRSAMGARDMAGNIFEWVADCWNENYEGAPSDGAPWLSGDCTSRVLRGAAWSFYAGEQKLTTRRWFAPAALMHGMFGARCARDIDRTRPALFLSRVGSGLVNSGVEAVLIEVVASEPLRGLEPGDVTVSAGEVVSVERQDPARYLIRWIPPADFDGTVSLFIPEGQAEDWSFNPSLPSNTIVLTVDTASPSMTMRPVGLDPDGIARGGFQVVIEASRPVSGVAPVTTAEGTPIEVIETGGPERFTLFIVPPDDFSGEIIVTLDLAAIRDDADNPATGMDTLAVTVDSLNPAPPRIDPIAGDDVVTLPERLSGFAITGTATAGLSVRLYFEPALSPDGARWAAVGEDGRWSLSLSGAELISLAHASSLQVRATSVRDEGAPPPDDLAHPSAVARVACVAQPEICDGLDNSCNGLTDATDPGLERPLCDLQLGVCAGSRRAATGCVNGTWEGECGPADYAGHAAGTYLPEGELCDGLDNDCNGLIDEGLGLGRACTEGLGTCLRQGVTVCPTDAPDDHPMAERARLIAELRAQIAELAGELDAEQGLVDEMTAKRDAVAAERAERAAYFVEVLEALSAEIAELQAALDALDAALSAIDDGIAGLDPDDPDYATALATFEEERELLLWQRESVSGSLSRRISMRQEFMAMRDSELGGLDEMLASMNAEVAGQTEVIVAIEAELGALRAQLEALLLEDGPGLTLCSAVAGAPSPEQCNGQDDDCDGLPDNIPGQLPGSICPAGGTIITSGPPMLTQDTRAVFTYENRLYPEEPAFECRLNNEAWFDCSGGLWVFEELEETVHAFQVRAVGPSGVPDPLPVVYRWQIGCVPGPEVCDGRDNSCNGLVDAEDPGLVRIPCDNQEGVCAGALRPASRCVPDGAGGAAWEPCQGVDYEANAAAEGRRWSFADDDCDGQDNNCDGRTDEGFRPQATTCGVGICAGNTGTLRCLGGGRLVDDCDPLAGSRPETCNGLDDDCDGFTDDGLVEAPACPTGLATCDDALGGLECALPDETFEPALVDDHVEVWEGGRVEIRPLDNDTGLELRLLEPEASSDGRVGRLDDFTLIFAPVRGFRGETSFTYRAVDSRGREAEAVVHVTVLPIDAPFEVEEASLDCQDVEDGAAALTLRLSGGTGSYRVAEREVEAVSVHRVSLTSAHELPVRDQAETTLTPPKTVAGLPLCEAPPRPLRAVADALELLSNTAGVVDVLANDEGQGLRLVMVTPPEHGEATMGPGHGEVRYQPERGFSGEDRFIYVVEDASGAAARAVVSVTVLGREVDARDDRLLAESGVPTRVEAAGNDRGAPTAHTVSQPEHGVVRLNRDGSMVYTSLPDYVGSDRFSYIAGEGDAETRATVWVTVTEPGACLSVTVGELETRCATDGAHYTVRAELRGGSGRYTVNGETAGITHFMAEGVGPVDGRTPPRGLDAVYVSGPVPSGSPLRLLIADAASGSACRPVLRSAQVNCEGGEPIRAVDSRVQTTAGVPALIRPADGDRGVGLTVVSVSRPASGRLEALGLGVYRYTPAEGFVGLDRFSYVIRDAAGETDGAVVVIDVAERDLRACEAFAVERLRPVCGAEGVRWAFHVAGGSGRFSVDGLTWRGREVEVGPRPSGNHAAIAIEDVDLPECGVLTVLAHHRCPSSSEGLRAVPDAVSVAPGRSVTFSPLDNDEGEGLSLISIASPEAGNLSSLGDGTFRYDAPATAGVVQTTYRVVDASGREQTGVIVFFVSPVEARTWGCRTCALEARDDRIDVTPDLARELDVRLNDVGVDLGVIGYQGVTRHAVSLVGQRFRIVGAVDPVAPERWQVRVRDGWGFEAVSTVLVEHGVLGPCKAMAGAIEGATAGCGGDFRVRSHQQGRGYRVGVAIVDAEGRLVELREGARARLSLPEGPWTVRSVSWREEVSSPQVGSLLAFPEGACAAVSDPVSFESLPPLTASLDVICAPGVGYFVDVEAAGGGPAAGVGGYTYDLAPLPPYAPGQLVQVRVSDETSCEVFESVLTPSASCGGNP